MCMCNHGDGACAVSGLATYMSSLLAQALEIHDGVRMGVPMHTASWERKREHKNSTEGNLQVCRTSKTFHLRTLEPRSRQPGIREKIKRKHSLTLYFSPCVEWAMR